MLRRIMAFKVSENKHENVPHVDDGQESDAEKDKSPETQPLPGAIFTPQ